MAGTTAPPAPLAAFPAGPVAAVSAVLATVLTALSGRYGFHRDELYFLAAGKHPDWGYIDQPPLTPLLARASVFVFGETPMGLRVVSTVACVLTVVVVALIAREFGAAKGAQVLAAIAAGLSGFVLAVGHMVGTSTFDLLLWLSLIWVVLRVLRTGDSRRLLPAGVLIGIGVQNKYLIGLLVVVLLAAVLAVGPRARLRTWWLLAAAAVALVIAAPNLLWQAAHGWPQLAVAGGISADDGVENRVMFIPLQLMYLSPLLVPVWIVGGLRLWRDPALRWGRSVALAYPVMCLAVLIGGGKSYYVLPILLALTAAGATPTLAWLRRRPRWVPVLATVLVAASSALTTLPVLPPTALNAVNGVNPELGEQVGWPQLASAAAQGWEKIPPAQRPTAVIFTQNYGQAGAIDQYGPDHGLPGAYSGHMSYADWGPPPDTATGPVLLVRQRDSRPTTGYFTDCRVVATVENGQDVDNEEQHATIELCSGPVEPWSTLWPRLRRLY
ncbi:hypothetical protein Afil01_29500 [Actinorhabdospora filicis]|uniref:Glycosyltransferase RgtA/B/C/D-like domain-containing protein n=1 Tax=Actinorhabdospora filicis TaxID=1785913 RepID=A0A9W6W9M3_9ACTN|nr:glycosyltransferase family 39 protein [Actinorhabdospora filicis]GLZ78143.1 hypothetical protein Afil01_29500 [Actinorhabdospora filicis]